MFLTAVSSDNRDKTKINDVASVFNCLLEQPITLLNFEIELVSCIITQQNLITISSANNMIVMRIGTDETSEQYMIRLREGKYTIDNLANEIQNTLRDITPIQSYVTNDTDFTWNVLTDGATKTKLQIKFDAAKLPATSVISDKLNKSVNSGFIVNRTFPAGAGGNTAELNTTFGTNAVDSALRFGNEPFDNIDPQILPDGIELLSTSATGLDMGDQNVESRSSSIYQNVGIQETGGRISVQIPSVLCVKETNYCKGGGSADFNSCSYFVIENNTRGTVYDNINYEQSFLNPKSKTHLLTDNLGQEYQAGLVVSQSSIGTGDPRGTPYSIRKAGLIFPTNRDVTFDGAGSLTGITNRKEVMRSTWNGNILFDRRVGDYTDTNSYNFIEDRAFSLNIDFGSGTNPRAESNSTLYVEPLDKTETRQKEPIKMRLAVKPLIAGLQQGNSANLPTQTLITKSGSGSGKTILFDSGGTPGTATITYIVGSIGEFNNEFGLAGSTVAGKNSGIDGNGRKRTPRYKITKIDGSGKPEVVVLVDSGEHINANEKLMLNDPNTFTFTKGGLATDSDVVDNLCLFVTPQADDIGVQGAVFINEHRYLPFQLGMVNDLINTALTENNDLEEERRVDLNCDFAKDLTINLVAKDTSTGTSGVGFEVRQWQPNNTLYANEAEIVQRFTTDPTSTTGETLVWDFDDPATWNTSCVYNPARTPGSTPPALIPWTLFDGSVSTSRIRLEVEINNVFEALVAVSYSQDGGATYNERVILLQTFEDVTIDGTPFNKMECTAKSRLFPYHPVMSQYPASLTTAAGINQVQAQGILLSYPERKNKVGRIVSNYDKNLSNIPPGSVIPSIFDFPVDQNAIGGGDLTKPPIMFKFGPNIIANPTPSITDVGQLPANDIPPVTFSNFASTGGFPQSIFAITGDYSGGASPSLVIDATDAPDYKAFMDTFLVECPSITAKGYNMYNFNLAGNRVGTGVESQVIGVVPFVESNNTLSLNSDSTTLRYSTPYHQPVLVKLPVKTNIYNLEFRLRDIQTGQYLSGLQNPTQLILRINELPDI